MAPRFFRTLAGVAIIFLASLQFNSQARMFVAEQLSTSSSRGLNRFLDGINPFSLSTSLVVDDLGIRAVSPSQLSKTDAANDPHFSTVEFLDLFDWELQSDVLTGIDDESKNSATQEGQDDLQPPSDISKMCRVGTLTNSRNTCGNQSVVHYYSLRDSVLRNHVRPLPASGMSTTKCDLCRILNLCLEHNITFGIYGDSMTRQMMESFECALFRRGYKVQKPFQGKAYTQFIISSPHWGERFVTIHYHMQFKVLSSMSNPQAPGNHPDINAILTSFGLHNSAGAIKARNNQANYQKGVARLYGHLKTFMTMNSTTADDESPNKFKLMLHRETSAQHFDAEGGDFFWARDKKDQLNSSALLTCVPFQQGSSAGWREAVVKEAAIEAGFEFDTLHVEWLQRRQPSAQVLPSSRRRDKIVVLPFFNFTTTLHEDHPLNQDCTHFCYSPYLWWPLWRSLRIAMEEGLPSTPA
jgi:hypothetical protein